jgi:uncharacterized protein (DUF1810 family)
MSQEAFGLQRFVKAQEQVYPAALAEVRAGCKRTHWMWFVFPQIEGLGSSPTSRCFAVRGVEEARAYLAHPVLGARLRECADALLRLEGRSATEIFGDPDDLKLRSSMTLFELAAGPGSVFGQVIDKYFDGRRDPATLRLAGGGAPPRPGQPFSLT